MNSVPLWSFGPGFAMAQACSACGHTRCGAACGCDCASVRGLTPAQLQAKAADDARRAEALAFAREHGCQVDPRVSLWNGVIRGDRRVRIETYYGRLEVYTRPLGASAWRVATEQEEAEATIQALDEKPWVEERIRAGCLERHRARAGGAQ